MSPDPAIPGANPASRLFGYAVPPDGGPAIGPDQYWPQPGQLSFHQVLEGLNPLQHVPGVGMIYRAVMHEELPPPLRILGSLAFGAATGGPFGALASVFMTVGQALLELRPDTSGPAAPPGFQVAGSEAGYQPVAVASPGASPPAGVMLASEWQRTQLLEHGMA